MKDTKIPMVLFGIIAVVAVVGMVLMFTQERNTEGMMAVGPFSNQPGWYTNYDQSQYPYWSTVQPVNIPAGSIEGSPSSKVPGEWYPTVSQQRLINYVPGTEKRNPEGNIPSALSSCGRNYRKYSWQEAQGKVGDRDWYCIPIEQYAWGGSTEEIDIGKGGAYCCAYIGQGGQASAFVNPGETLA
ncbi:hypothetical protein KY329_00120 [Candidatus Woesearchaeota archaeon]|nr:hypothetical protein [Candidatus Woesearchaeota archaeon]